MNAPWKRLISYGVWPTVMIGSLIAADWGFARFPTGVWAFSVSIANFIVVFALEWLLPQREGIGRLRDPQLPRDIGHGMLVGGVGRPLAGPLAAGSIGIHVGIGSLGHLMPRWPGAWPQTEQVLLALFLSSFVGYWSHRCFHRFSPLWRFHALHHDIAQMHVFKGNRIHIGEDLTRQFVMLVPLYAVGVPDRALVWVALWNNFEGALAHSNLSTAFPFAAHWILPTPQNHYVHHALVDDLHDCNYAGFTPLWDIVFGTYRHPDRNPVTAVGIDHSTVPAGFLAQLAYPLRSNPSATSQAW